jgi:hypothetical protein
MTEMDFFIKKAFAEDKLSEEVIKSLSNALGFDYGNIFTWALGFGGIIALGVIIYGGILYISSEGNVSKQSDAKEWIKSAIYGLFLLLAGFMILYTINPAIVGR